jgi:hypothetical protein
MWEADKIYYNGEDDFVRAFQNGKIIWSKVQELILFTDSDGLTYNGVELVPNQPNYVPVPTDSTMPKIPNGVTEVYWRNYDNRKNNITSLEKLNDGNKALVTFDAEGSNFEGITDMSGVFFECRNLTTIPQMDTSNVTNITGVFFDCNSLTTIPQMDTSNVTNMSYMFAYCYSLMTIPQLNTSNVVDMRDMFYKCNSLITIPQMDTSNVTIMSDMFWECSSLENVGGFIGLKVDLNMGDCPLTLDSVYNIANTVATVDGQTITLSDHTKALLNDEVREIFASKGWIIN